jgi:hypothetical protein
MRTWGSSQAEAQLLPRPGARDQMRYLRTILRDPQPVLDELRDRYRVGMVVNRPTGGAAMRVAARR